MNKKELINEIETKLRIICKMSSISDLEKMLKELNNSLGDMSESELKDFIIELQEENSRYERKNKKYKEVIDKLNNKINLLKTCEDKPKEDIIYPHWEICNETKQELLDIIKEVE